MNNDEILSTVVAYFEDYQTYTMDARALNERDRDYVDHKQLTEEERRILKARKQPPTINNRIRKKINFLRGYERQVRTDPSARPRTPQHENDADSITDALRYVSDNINFDVIRSDFWDNYIVEGTGGCEVIVSKGRKEIQTINIPWDRLFWDPHSRRPDFSDARYTGIVIWDDADNVKAEFPGSDALVETCFTTAYDDTYEDKPTIWVDSKRRRIRIIQIYYKMQGKWYLCIFTKAGFLLDPKPSPWLDEFGEPENGMILQSAYVDRQGNRFGEPRFMIETQDAINKRESKMLHLVSQRQTFGNKRAFPDGVRQAKQELAKPDGHIEINSTAEFNKDFGILPTGDMAQGQFQLLQEAKQEIDQTSVSGFLPGQNDGEKSGRRVLADQTGSQIELNPLTDGKRQWELRVYRAWWNRIRQFWTDQRWVRVTDNEDNIKFVGLNRPVTVLEHLQQNGIQIPPELINDPRLQMVSRIENEVAQMDIDVILEDAPDVTVLQQEEFRNLVELANVGITFDKDVYIMASNLRHKQKILEQLRGKDEAQAAQIQQSQQVQQQLQAELLSATAENEASASLLKQAQALKARADANKIMKETEKVITETDKNISQTNQIDVETAQMRAGLK